MPFFREYVLHNWGLKLVALGLSILLWTTYTSEPMAEVGYQVPIAFINIPHDLEISGDVPTQVHVRVRGRPSLLRRLTPADLGLRVDLAGGHAGENVLPLAPAFEAPYGATVVRIAPAQIRVPLVSRRTSP